MNQKERLAICSTCTRRKLDFEYGYTCQQSGKFADFKDTCSHFVLDETVTDNLKIRTKERPMVPLFDPVPAAREPEVKKKTAKTKAPKKKVSKEQTAKTKVSKEPSLSKEALRKLRKYQSFLYAVLGGLLITAVCSFGWAFISAKTGFQSIYMALGVGLLVGVAVRFFGAGIHWIFGILAVLLTLAGSLMGYFLSLTGFPDETLLAGMSKVSDYLSPNLMLTTMWDAFAPLDLIFYGLAAVLGYLLAIRRINLRKMAKLESENYKGAPALYWLRLPLILAGILLPTYIGYTLTRQDQEEITTLYYDSGEKLAEGKIRKGLESGEWTSWHMNGKIMSTGYYHEGQKDSLWQWYDESGILTGTGMYSLGMENGTWMHFYPDGEVADSGAYQEGLKEGPWKYFHETGELKLSVIYRSGSMHGERILLSASGKIVKTEYYENGVMVEKEL